MTNKPINNSNVYSLAWPIGMNAILQQAILFIDTILVGGLGEHALAAMGIAVSVAGLILGLLFAFANGTQILVAQAYGASSNKALKSGFWSGLIVGLIVAIIGIAFIVLMQDTIVGKLTDNADVASMASSYLLITTVVIAGVALCQNISVYLYATNTPRIPLYSKLLELPFNALISYALIYGEWGFPELGLKGAAIGSAVAVVMRSVFLIYYLLTHNFNYLLTASWAKNSVSATVVQHLQNALPIAGTFISMNFAFTVCMTTYSQLGIYEFAAFTILLIWIRTSGMLVTAWSQAIGILVGRLLGQNRMEQLDKFVSGAWRIALVVSLAIAVLYAITPWLFKYIYPNLEPKTLNVIKTILPLLILLPLVRSSNTVCGNILRAAGQANYAFMVHVTTQWLFTVPMTLLFVLVLDMSVIWVFGIIVVEELLKALPFHLRIASGIWKQRLKLQH